MKIQFRDRDVKVTEVLRTHVARRLGVALGRFGERIGGVIVRLSDIKGRLGGLDKRCEIRVGLRPRFVHAEDTDSDPFAAVVHASDRVSRSVGRALERERELDEGTRRSRTPRRLKG